MIYTIILAFTVAAFASPVEEKRQVTICNSGDLFCCAPDDPFVNDHIVSDLSCENRNPSHTIVVYHEHLILE
jgi:hypothetical protein